VIIACESMAAELLAGLPEFERGTKPNSLEAFNASMGVALQNDDLLTWAKADDKFHRLLVVSCGNRRIAETIMDQSHRARRLTLKLRPKPTQSMGQVRDGKSQCVSFRQGTGNLAGQYLKDIARAFNESQAGRERVDQGGHVQPKRRDAPAVRSPL
jgi:DNA-binding GntR family transcriptional regulator